MSREGKCVHIKYITIAAPLIKLFNRVSGHRNRGARSIFKSYTIFA